MRRYRGFMVSGLALVIALAACSGESEPPTAGAAMTPQSVTVTAELFYRERIALPPGAVAVAALEIAGSGTVVAEAREELADRQVPVAVTLVVDRSRLPQDAGLVFRGSIEVDGERQWQSAPLPVDLTSETVGLGPVLLRAVEGPDTVVGGWVVEDILDGASSTTRASRSNSVTRVWPVAHPVTRTRAAGRSKTGDSRSAILR